MRRSAPLHLLAVSLIFSFGCSAQRDSASSLGHAEYPYDFTSLEQMVATSSLVVEGTVTKVGRGPVVGGKCTDQEEASGVCEGDGAVQFMNVVLKLDRVFFGASPKGADSITVTELPTLEIPLTPENSHGFYFLNYSKQEDRFVIINPEGRIFVGEGQTLLTPDEETDDWLLTIASETPAEFRADLEAAVGEVKSGAVEPAVSPY
jgi:hypothetical protein